MNEQIVERIVRSMVVAVMNGMLYFPDHRRVVEATEEAATALDAFFTEKELFTLALQENFLIYEGTPLYDLSLFAHKLVEIIGTHGGWGLRFESGVTPEEIRGLVALLLGPETASADEANGLLKQQGIVRAALEERALTERVSMLKSGADAARALDHQHISRDVYTGALAALQDIMVDLHKDRQVSFKQANDIAENLARSMRKNRDSFLMLTSVKDYDAYTFNHSVNVAIYASSLAETLTTRADEVVQIAQSALLHDVGKLLIADEILYKPGMLSDEEWEIMRQHPFLGAKILMESEGVPDLAVNVAYGHHIFHNGAGRGYPKLKGDVKLDPVTELIKVIDFYEAVTAKRPYKKPMLPELAAQLMLKGSGQEFNPVCVDAFLRHFGVFPVGIEVVTDDGFESEVVAVNAEHPFRPSVRLTKTPDGEPITGGEVRDTAEQKENGEFVHALVHSPLT
jgi:putative nucleotidyltransferase with HDIG domain